MTKTRNRLRMYALALVLCTLVFWNFRSREYDHAYSEVRMPPFYKPPKAESSNGYVQRAENNGGYYDCEKHEFQLATPTQEDAPKSVAQAQEVANGSQGPQEDTYRNSHEKEKYMEEMGKYENRLGKVQGNPKAGISYTKSKQKKNSNELHAAKATPLSPGGIDWSRFAYTQYATNAEYLCNSVMIFETLHRLGSKAGRVLMYPFDMLKPDAEDSATREGKLMIGARDKFGVKLMPIKIQHREGADSTWADSFTKLLAFNQTQYDRVLSLDSDGMVLQPMDELFLLPPCPIAMPRAYWLLSDEGHTKPVLSSQVMLIQPDHVEFQRIMEKIKSTTANEYDMEIVNNLYRDSAMILPHRPYNMITGEWRQVDHSNYLGSDREEWDPLKALKEAKFLHFSDWPVLKPWVNTPEMVILRNQPRCHMVNGIESCVERDMWKKFYSGFADQRHRVCGLGKLEQKR